MLLLAIVPNTDGPIRRTGRDDGLLETDIHAEDRVRVEPTDEVIVADEVFRVAAVEGDRHFKDLVGVHGEDEAVFFGGEGHAGAFHVG